MIHLFGNPAILKVRIRGIASPDLSGLARSESIFKTKVLRLKHLHYACTKYHFKVFLKLQSKKVQGAYEIIVFICVLCLL